MKRQPLAYRMRPTSVEEVIGQHSLLGKGMMLSRMIKANQLSSMVLYGPPGTGKTSIARAIAGSSGMHFRMLNATVHHKKDMETAVEEAKMYGSLLLILDEVHRLDKAKQDFLLPHLESGLLLLIGATTANPYHSINPAIRSRCHIFELEQLEPDDIEKALRRALADEERGLGHEKIDIAPEALRHLALACGGDVRAALNALELAVLSTPKQPDGTRSVTLRSAEQSIQKKSIQHDKDGDAHYDVLSAFQKSIRGSDVNASLHYLARLLEAGDLISIHRRLLVIAYEDISLANPQAGPRTLAAIEASERLGLPEARIPLANAVVELALSPKSNSAYKALDAAIDALRKGGSGEVPRHLKDAHYKGAQQLGRGSDYKYPHDYKDGWVKQQYLPDKIADHRYYEPKQTGKFEQALSEMYKRRS
ncbi:replication-associated recombination protein A [Shouchella clausii]|uniref:replication-associated recombination protein A n=1 Tax=Shouchella TaxID=2893057 RepID=UPI0004E631A4|nr:MULTISPECIES: replication-associated recombination protein A [Shouchella]ALA51263.1 putative ATPase (AAA family) associated with cysteine desulfurase [Shouchella clausii]MBU3232679.1 replication-associated recombination protein A [Shouchella clausii]MBU3265576.1 replication-associated recombination protein A [Shouchella clausii]MBU3508595.1 replication-associated recombination protein A [Shouchella clausii]MBU3535220.1 replication-associated recombination protein A [Shouchella clausii]